MASAAPAAPVAFAQVKAVLEQRCTMCHGEQVQMKNVRLDSAANVKLSAPLSGWDNDMWALAHWYKDA